MRDLARARIRIPRLREEEEIQRADRAEGPGLRRREARLRKGRYGYRRINRELRRDGIAASEKRVPAAMRKLGLQAKRNAFKHIELHYNRRRRHLAIG